MFALIGRHLSGLLGHAEKIPGAGAEIQRACIKSRPVTDRGLEIRRVPPRPCLRVITLAAVGIEVSTSSMGELGEL